jgi:hypothetical protein
MGTFDTSDQYYKIARHSTVYPRLLKLNITRCSFTANYNKRLKAPTIVLLIVEREKRERKKNFSGRR